VPIPINKSTPQAFGSHRALNCPYTACLVPGLQGRRGKERRAITEEGTCALECPRATAQKTLTVVREAKMCELLNL